MRLLTLLTCACLFSGILKAQKHEYKMLFSLSSKELDICLARLPDSTVLISSYREGTCRCYHLAWKDSAWVKLDSRLADLVNGLMPRSTAEPHFRFTDDFTRIVVTIQEALKNNPVYESSLVNGEWSLFTPINIDQELNVWHALAMTSD